MLAIFSLLALLVRSETLDLKLAEIETTKQLLDLYQ